MKEVLLILVFIKTQNKFFLMTSLFFVSFAVSSNNIRDTDEPAVTKS